MINNTESEKKILAGLLFDAIQDNGYGEKDWDFGLFLRTRIYNSKINIFEWLVSYKKEKKKIYTPMNSIIMQKSLEILLEKYNDYPHPWINIIIYPDQSYVYNFFKSSEELLSYKKRRKIEQGFVNLDSSKLEIKIIEVVEQENKERPLSDKQITELIESQGYAVLSSEVKAVREKLNIPVRRKRVI
ncbi:MAG: hypothetical protein AAFP82_09450 [Bacteroidota bacterium]